MKKTWLWGCICIGILGLAACGNVSSPAQSEEVHEAVSEVSPVETESEEPEEIPSETGSIESREESVPETEENITEEGSAGQNLIVYFSRWGNTGYEENVDATTSASIIIDQDTFGTTEYVARMIQEETGGELHFIQTQESYPVDFDELREQNHREMDEGYLPLLVESDLDLSQYDTVFIGYPVWAGDVPQAVLSFLNAHSLSGKKIVPFCTHEGYGAGSSYQTLKQASPDAVVEDGLAIEASDVPNAEESVKEWLDSLGY